MVSQTRPSGTDAVVRLLAAYRLPIYGVGLAVIGFPIALASAFGIELSSATRTALVTASLAAMIVTYVAERRVRGDDGATDDGEETYPLEIRVVVAAAVVGIAVGVYVALEVNPIAGVAFLLGAYFFGYLAFKGREP